VLLLARAAEKFKYPRTTQGLICIETERLPKKFKMKIEVFYNIVPNAISMSKEDCKFYKKEFL